MKILLIWLVLVFIYGLAVFKNPYQTNNLIGNLEPYPDTLYYSVPAWNFVKGQGFEMRYEDKKINSNVPPLYGGLLIPFVYFSGDIRSLYFLNIILAVISIFIFIKLAASLFVDKWIVLGLGLIWVTNFYNYNLPTLLMAENLLIPLILTSALILVAVPNKMSIRLSWLLVILMIFTKMSALPVILVLICGMLIKVWQSKDRQYVFEYLMWGLGLGVIGIIYLLVNIKVFSSGNSDMSLENLSKNAVIYVRQILGVGSTYLWYQNQLLEKFIGFLGLSGMLVGLTDKKYRSKILGIVGIIAAVILFHSLKYYPEGRYVSIIVPLIIFLIGVPLSYFKKYAGVVIGLLIIVYFGSRVTINGFTERKITTVKRQVLNNFRTENEVPWNYNAVLSFNKYFSEESEDVYLATLLPAFYVNYFSNYNYKLLPVSRTQEFSGPGKLLVEQYYLSDGSIIKMYERMMAEGKEIYITNYYLQNHRGDWDTDFKEIENHFAFSLVSDECLGLCKIYKLEKKNQIPNTI